MDECTSAAGEPLTPETWPIVAAMTNAPLSHTCPFADVSSTLYHDCGGIEAFREGLQRFASLAARRSTLSRLLPHRELDWLRVRLLQLLVHAAGAPVPYAGPSLHNLYQQHALPALLADEIDELLFHALCSHMNRPAARSVVQAAKSWRRTTQ